MDSRSRFILKASLAVIGTIIGAGVFALPATFASVGFWPGSILFWGLAIILLVTHLLLVESMLSFDKRMRLVGLAEKTLGPVGFRIAGTTYPLQTIGVNFAYVILGGEFLRALAVRFGLGGDVLFWQLLFWFGGSLIVFLGLRFVAKVEAAAVWLLIGGMLLVALLAFGTTHGTSMTGVQNWSEFLFPFGVFLFSLSGLSVMGEVVELVQRRRKDAHRVVIIGTLGAAFLAWIFGTSLAYASGGSIGRNPSDLIALLPPFWSWVIPVVGFLAVATSYITSAQDLKTSFFLDFHVGKISSWVLAMFLPMFLLLLTASDFLTTIGWIGTIFGGINGILVGLIAEKRGRDGFLPPSAWIAVAPSIIIGAYVIGLAHFFIYR